MPTHLISIWTGKTISKYIFVTLDYLYQLQVGITYMTSTPLEFVATKYIIHNRHVVMPLVPRILWHQELPLSRIQCTNKDQYYTIYRTLLP